VQRSCRPASFELCEKLECKRSVCDRTMKRQRNTEKPGVVGTTTGAQKLMGNNWRKNE